MEISHGIIETLKRVCRCFTEAGITFCLVGGLAVSMLAKPRATEDIDFLVLLEEQELSRLADLLGTCTTIVDKPALMRFANATIQRFIVQDPCVPDAGLLVVDFLLANTEIYRKVLDDVVVVAIDGTPVPVPRRDHLIAIKKLSSRPQDLIDIASLQETEDI